jgi:SNF2 family DNA or RNA helicase
LAEDQALVRRGLRLILELGAPRPIPGCSDRQRGRDEADPPSETIGIGEGRTTLTRMSASAAIAVRDADPKPGAGSDSDFGLSAEFEAYLPLVRRLARPAPIDAATCGLVEEAIGVWSRPGFDTFVSLPRLRFTPFDHQLRAASSVLRGMHGRAILADEVGLGKTIEAGLVLSELRLRGLAARVLVLVPAGLVEQWQEELERKFALPSVVAKGGVRDSGTAWQAPTGSFGQPVVVASLPAACRSRLRDALIASPWDLVVVDEAHRVKRPQSASGRLARSLRSRYLLLLTATPVENRLADLYQLVNLVRPGHLGTPQQFRARHGATGQADPARDLAGLRAKTAQLMVRHRRSEVALMLPRRLAETLCVAPGDDEAALYQAVSRRVRSEGRSASPTQALTLRTVQRLAGSSPWALAPTLNKVGWDDLAALAREVAVTRKARVLVELLRRHASEGEKVVVFTAFRQTLEFLAGLVAEAGIDAVSYHGSLRRAEKEAAIAAFQAGTPVLLTTEAAGEGRNLQFCHVMVNFDLPWNPMQVEQRLGRIHRIGQQHDVVLTNLVTKGTIEERILRVLEAKINLFELVVGELDMILGRVEDDFDFETFVFTAHVDSADDAEFDTRLETLGEDLIKARAGYLETRDRVDQLVEFAGEEGAGHDRRR